VRAEVELINRGAMEKQLRKLDARSVRFFFGRPGAPERMEREAVASKNESMNENTTLGPGLSARRPMLLTRLSEFPARSSFRPLHPGGASGQRPAAQDL